jgi:site-specific recombinase XerD
MKWIETPSKGIRYREHPTRKHGKVQKDRYYAIRFQKDGRRKEEGLGWASGGWTLEKAVTELSKLKEAAQRGEGPTRLAEKREIAENRKNAEIAEKKRLELQAITFGEIFEKQYLPIAKQNKTTRAWKTEESLNKIWIKPIIGKLPLGNISIINLERIKKNMTDGGKAARSIQYTLAVIRQVFNFAHNNGIFAGENPVTKVKKPKIDNRRLRFLTHAEADELLSQLMSRSRDVYDMALLSLHCGLRAGETFSLTWTDVNINKGILTMRDTKSGKTRYAYMTDTVMNMFRQRECINKNDFVFPTKTGGQRNQVSKLFNLVINELHLNDGISDTRNKIVWHSLRHTFASWHVEAGTDIYILKELLGHSVIAMTARYSHLGKNTLQAATKNFQEAVTRNGQKEAGQIVNFTK